MVYGSRFMVDGFCLWFRVSGSGWLTTSKGFWLRGLGFWFLVSGFWFLVSGFWFLVSCFMLQMSSFWFRVSGFGVRFSGFWFLVSGLGWLTASTMAEAGIASTVPIVTFIGVGLQDSRAMVQGSGSISIGVCGLGIGGVAPLKFSRIL